MLGIHGLSDIKKRTDGRYWSHIHKFGSTSAGGTGSIWSYGGLYPWSALDNPQTLYVSSTVGDGDDGSVELQGLDENWNLLTETVSLSGSPSETTTTNTFRRIFRMRYSATNVGSITARTVSHAGTVVAEIEPTKSQTLMAVYTVPAGRSGYLLNYTAGVGKGDDTNIELFIREKQTEAFRIKSEATLFQNYHRQEFSIPLELPPKSDIDFRSTASGGAGNSICTLNFDLVLHQWDRS